MSTRLTTKGQVTIPKQIRDELGLLPGTPIDFSVNRDGEVVLQKVQGVRGKTHKTPLDRFDAARGKADVQWRTQELMALLRG